MRLQRKINSPLPVGSIAWLACCNIGPQICFAPEGGEGGGGGEIYSPEGMDEGMRGATNNATIDNLYNANKELTAAQEDAGKPYHPEGLAEHLQGANNNETIDKMMKENTGFRDAQGKQGTVPDSPDGYNFELSEKAKAVFDLADDDKGLKLFKEVLHKDSVSEQSFAAFPKFIDAAIEAGMIKEPVTADDVFASLAPDDFKGGKLDAIAEGAKRVTTALAHVDTLLGNEKIDEGVAKEMKLLVGSADGVKTLEMFMNKITDGNQTGGEGGGENVTKDTLQTRVADPKNDRNNKEYDRKFAEETNRQYKEFYKGRA